MLSVSIDTLFIWGNRVAENILIVGNGFDLSHYLPTKYDHFVDVMSAIESSTSDVMNFDDLFAKCRETAFIARTKEYYHTQDITLDKAQLTEIRKLLKENCWYQYFDNHVQQIKTWIDFEQKIEHVLNVISICIKDIKTIDNTENIFKYFTSNLEDNLSIKDSDRKIISHFNLIGIERVEKKIPPPIRKDRVIEKEKIRIQERENLNPKFCYGEKIQHGFNPLNFLDFMYKELEKFIEIFNLYLDFVVSQLRPTNMFDIESRSWIQPDKIFSFNYTNTCQRIYDSIEVEYL